MDRGHEKITVSEGVSLYYQWQRVENASAVILIVHGVGEHIGRYQLFESWFCEHGFSCFGYDQRGHGQSDGMRTHVDSFLDYAEDLQLILSMVRSKEPVLPVFLFSHSMGALVALMNRITFSDNQFAGVILSSCAIQPGRSLPAWMLNLLYPLFSFMPKLRVPTFIHSNRLTHELAVIDCYEHDDLVETSVTLGWLKSFSNVQKEILENIHKVHVPLLILHSEADQVASIKGSRELTGMLKTSDVTFIEYQSLYHELHNEVLPDRERVFKEIFDWCKSRG